MQLVIAEKPSVARDIARVLGVRPTGQNAFSNGEWVISWCVGHLVELDEPAAYDSRWKAWRMDALPMLPTVFKLRPAAGTLPQFTAVARLLGEKRFSAVVNACDAGREGELIFRYVYDLAGSTLPVKRLWISSMTDEAIRAGFAQLRGGYDYEPLAAAARCRSEADWLVGLNATRAVTVRHRSGGSQNLYSIGRVQTPTLGLLVDRERAIRAFTPQDYWEVRADLQTQAGGTFRALWTHLSPPAAKVTRFSRQEAAQVVVERCATLGDSENPLGPTVESLEQKKTREPPPFLFDLTSLQRTANRRFGLSASRTLEVAQSLYERHKLLTYPRTDSRFLSQDMVAELPKLFRGLAQLSDYSAFARPLLESPPLPPRRVFDDKKVHDHHAIVPTGKAMDLSRLDRDERHVFDLVVRRFLGAFYPDAEFANTEVVVRVGPAAIGQLPAVTKRGQSPTNASHSNADDDNEAMLSEVPSAPDRFVARGRIRLLAGWQVVAGFGEPAGEAGEGDLPNLPVLVVGQKLLGRFEPVSKQTKPPPRYTEGTLLAAMETAGRQIEDEELRAAMKDSGLGTPATRASIIETLVKRGFVQRNGKQIFATDTGMSLVAALPVPSLASPELTGSWEARLSRIARRQDTREAFMRDIAIYVTEVVAAIRKAPVDRNMMAPMNVVPAPKTADSRRSSVAKGETAVASAESSAGRESPSRRRASSAARAEPSAARAEPSAGRGASSAERGKSPLNRSPVTRGSGADSKTSAKPAANRQPNGKPRATKASRKTAPDLASLVCPRCKQGHVVRGNKGWGCSRWKQGCGFVIWFVLQGKTLSDSQVAELITNGKTRKATWADPSGKQLSARLVLDLGAPRAEGAARLEPA